jgi:DNA-binding transcriptional regulator YhcF (GntR family)
MRQMMQKYKKTGYLQADLPSGVRGLRDSCRVEITLKAGEMVSCSITSSRGLLLTGDKAYQELIRQGRIHWTFVSSSPLVTQTSPVRALEKNTVSRPHRTITVGQMQMRSWPYMHKLVYGLVDGTKSVAEIAEQLSATPRTIEEVLRDLQSIGVIMMQ